MSARWASDLAGTKKNTFGILLATFTAAGLSAARTYTLPDSTGTVPLLERTQTFTGTQTFSGNGGYSISVRSTPNGTAGVNIDSEAGDGSFVNFRTGTSLRWYLGKEPGAESGGNAGSPFYLAAYGDAGTLIGTVFTVTRATRVLNFTVAPTFTGVEATTRSNLGLGTAALLNQTTVGGNFVTLANPGAVTFPRIDAANTVTARSAANFRTDLGVGTGDTPTFAGLVVDAGNIQHTRTGDAANLIFQLDVDAGQAGTIFWRTGTAARWAFSKGAAAESGSDAGSPFTLAAYNDAGTILGTVFSVTRATQVLAFTVSPTAPTPGAGDNSTKVCTTAGARLIAPNNSYRNIMERDASHIAGRANGTYAIGCGDAAPISGTGTLYPWGIFYYDPADHPTIDGLTPKLRVRGQIIVNDTAPAATFVIALHPITHTGATGAAGLNLSTIGAAVAGSAATTITTPAADSLNQVVGSDFAAPTAGWYCLGFVQSGGAIAASSHLHIAAQLQMRNT